MGTTIKDGVITTLTPYGLELRTSIIMHDVISYVDKSDGYAIYKNKTREYNQTDERVRRIHDADVADFLKQAQNKDLRKPLNF